MDPRDMSSSTVTLNPRRSSRASAKWDAMKPAPPVMRTFLTLPSRVRRTIAGDFSGTPPHVDSLTSAGRAAPGTPWNKTYADKAATTQPSPMRSGVFLLASS